MQRLGVNINDETAAALRRLAERDEMTVTEVVRRAVSVYTFVRDETEKGQRFQLTNGQTVTDLRMMP
jgi:hypothetical protein